MQADIKPACERCGMCCYYYKEGVLKACKHLVRLKSGKTLCRVWSKRLTQVLDKVTDKEGKVFKIRCIMRSSCNWNYPGCPFNKEGLPEFKITKEDIRK